MGRCLAYATLAFAMTSFTLLCLGTGTTRWKEDFDIYKGMRKYIGLWRACILVSGNSVAELPDYYECDKDFLRPHLVEPPAWFNAVRALMLMACIGSGIGIILIVTALVTHQAKKTGSRLWISALVVFISGISAMTALAIFTKYQHWSVQYAYSSGQYFAVHWSMEPTESIVDGVFFKIETWLRWSYGIAWGGSVMAVFTLVTAILADLTHGHAVY